MKQYKNLVLGGGSMHGCMYIGVLVAMFNGDKAAYAQWTKGVSVYAGTSAGSLFAYMLLVADPWTVWDYVKRCGFRDIAKGMFDQSMAQASQQQSISSGKALEDMLRTGVQDLSGDVDMTLQQLFERTGKKLVVTVTSVQSGRVEYWSYTTKPHVPVWKALRASVSIPFVFPAFVVDGQAYHDGGIMCNVPCHLFNAKDTLTLFVHRPNRTSCSAFTEVLDRYCGAAQLGQFRLEPLYALNCVPCVSDETIVAAHTFGATDQEIDSVVQQGALSWNAVMARNVYMLFGLYFVLALRV